MTYQKKYRSQDGEIFTVQEVVQTAAGLTVFYTNETTQKEYSCLIDAFGERFRLLEDES